MMINFVQKAFLWVKILEGEGRLSTREPFSYDYGTGLHLNRKSLQRNPGMEFSLKNSSAYFQSHNRRRHRNTPDEEDRA